MQITNNLNTQYNKPLAFKGGGDLNKLYKGLNVALAITLGGGALAATVPIINELTSNSFFRLETNENIKRLNPGGNDLRAYYSTINASVETFEKNQTMNHTTVNPPDSETYALKNMNGDITVTNNSNIKKRITDFNGDVFIKDSTVTDVGDANGMLNFDNSTANGVVVGDNIVAEKSTFNGNVHVKQAEVESSTFNKELDCVSIKLKGENTINHLVVDGSSEVILPKGSKLNGIVEFAKKSGNLVIEKGAEFVGEVKNGKLIKDAVKNVK